MIEKGGDKIEEIYVWLSLLNDLQYDKLKLLLKKFQSLKNLYQVSKNKYFFLQEIQSIKSYFSPILIENLVRQDLKKKAREISKNLLSQKIRIIYFLSQQYPKQLFSMHNPPIVLFEYGIEQNRDKKICYLSNHLSRFGKKVYQYFRYYLQNKVFIIGCNEMAQIQISFEDISNPNYQAIKQNPRYIFPMKKQNKKYELLCGFTQFALLIEMGYNHTDYPLIELLLEQGKEVLVVPGNIFNPNTYFSNYLIQEGATVILNKKDLDRFL